MIILMGMALVAGLVRVVADPIRTMVIGRELNTPGMAWMEAGRHEVAVDGIWAKEEIPLVIAALKGEGDKRILEVGAERIAAVIKAGCPACPECKKIYPEGAPPKCGRCGTNMQDARG